MMPSTTSVEQRKNTRSPLRRLAWGLGVFVFWLTLWQLLSMLVGQELLLPPPLLVAKTWLMLAGTAAFWQAAGLSLLRVLAGFAAGTIIGALCAFGTHYSQILYALLTPILRMIRAVPVASFIILALVWVRTEALPSFISAAMAIPMVWQSVSGALESGVSRELLEMAAVYGFTKKKTFLAVVLPSIWPTFLSGAVSALGFAWKSGIAAEVICQPKLSIGRQLQSAKVYLETPQVFAWTATVCLLSMGIEWLLARAVKKGGRNGR
ncbi:MAG: ABC transporter permease subunit [Clostridia bacterium]|nr:ABC transporter permease subunit [Clostridia bacterium]